MASILDGGIDFLAVARRPFERFGIGMSSNARQLTNEFLSNGRQLFNTLYIQSEDAELNAVRKIMAVRATRNVDRQDVVLKSGYLGNRVDTKA